MKNALKRSYELSPIGSQKSFYSKAIVGVTTEGIEILYSYGTPIIRRLPDKTLERLWDGWTKTTGRHIKAFCGLNKAEFMDLPLSSDVDQCPPWWYVNLKIFTPSEIEKQIDDYFLSLQKTEEDEKFQGGDNNV